MGREDVNRELIPRCMRLMLREVEPEEPETKRSISQVNITRQPARGDIWLIKAAMRHFDRVF
jgi:hypothetical protein